MKRLFAVLVGSCALVLGLAAPAFAALPHPFVGKMPADVAAWVGPLVHGKLPF